MLRAALYARVSTDRQKDEETVQNQLGEIRKAIEEDGNSLTEECEYIDEGWSGAILERPNLDIMRQDAGDEKFDILYVYDRGRLARKFVYQEIAIEELQGYGIAFKSLHDINGDSTEEKLMGGVMGLFHEYERAKITERFRIGKLNKVRRGFVVGTVAPFGYDYIPVKGKGANRVEGRIVINKQEAEVVRMVLGWIGDEGISLKEVIRRLYDKGIPPRKQKRPNWTSGPITRLARNEAYTGRYFWFKSESVVPKNPSAKTVKYQYRHTTKTSKKRKPKEEWFKLKIPRIVNDELYEKVQAQLDKNATFDQRCKKNPYLFGGLIYCPCGNKRTGEGHDKHFYYRCTSRILEFPLPRSCFEPGINVQVIDAIGWQKLTELLTQPQLLEEQIENYKEQQKARSTQAPTNEDINHRIKALEDEERRYVQAWGVGNMSESVYLERMNSITNRRKVLKKELAKSKELGNLDHLKDIDLNAVAEPFKEFLGKLPYENKLFTVRKIVDKVIATKEKVQICGTIPVFEPIMESHVGLHANDRHSRITKCWQI